MQILMNDLVPIATAKEIKFEKEGGKENSSSYYGMEKYYFINSSDRYVNCFCTSGYFKNYITCNDHLKIPKNLYKNNNYCNSYFCYAIYALDIGQEKIIFSINSPKNFTKGSADNCVFHHYHHHKIL